VLTWTDWLVGLLPFGLAGILICLRLCAAGATKNVTAKLMVITFALLALALFGISLAAKGYRERNSANLIVGAAMVVYGLTTLRKKLSQIWEQFPLTEEENEPKE